MSSKPYRFRKTEVTRAMKAVEASGIKARIEVDPVRKTIMIIPEESPQNGGAGTNPWDEVLTDAQDQKRSA